MSEFDLTYATEQIRRRQHPLRRLVKRLYLANLLSEVRGPTIDFGCGAGQLLERLPAGSLGLEVNPHLVTFLTARGLQVTAIDADARAFELPGLPSATYRTLVIAHVLEHLPDPAGALTTLLQSCRRIGVERVVVVVPGWRGFQSDRTHRTFIDRRYLREHFSRPVGGFEVSSLGYFPGPWEWLGRWFVYHELKAVFDRAGVGRPRDGGTA